MSSSQDYGRPSADEADESRPLLSGEEAETSRSGGTHQERVRRFFDRAVAPLKDPHSLRPLEKVLLGVAVLFALLFFLFVGLYASAKSRVSHGRPDVSLPLPHGEQVCTSPRCVLAASELLHSMDTTVDPCDDFYQFSVGGWLKEHPIPDDAGLFGMAQQIGADNARLMRQVLSGDDDGPTILSNGEDKEEDKIDKRNIAKLRNFYGACMNTKAQDKAGAKPVVDIVRKLEEKLSAVDEESAFLATLVDSLTDDSEQHDIYFQQPVVPPNRPPARHPPSEKPTPLPPRGGRQRGLTEALALAHAQGVPAFFDWFVEGEPVKDPKLATPYLTPSGLGFPDKVYYTDEDEIKFYEDHLAEAFVLLVEAAYKDKSSALFKKGKKGPSKKELRKQAKQVVEFEKDLAAITPDGEDLEDPLSTYNPTTIASLSYTFSAIDWTTSLAAMTVRVPKEVIVQSPSYLKGLDALVSRTKTPVLKAYLAWTALRTYGLQLGPNVPLRKPLDAIDRRAKGVDADVREDRGALCFAKTNEALGFLAGHFYVQKAFSKRARAIASDIIDSIIVAFKARLPELEWLDPKTREKAEVKANAIKIKVGWPTSPNTTDAAAMERFYSDLKVDKKDHFGNMARSLHRGAKRTWNGVTRPLDTDAWDMIPSEVNAYYNPGGNEIVFPAGILQPSYFSEFWPSYLQYGAFGNAAGHELSHAFDPSGRLFDEEGRLHDWWTNDTAAAFNVRRDCLIEQYGQYTIPNGKGGEEHLRARFTIGEDVADAGGMAQSFRAWSDSMKRNDKDVLAANALLPGLNYSREQLFFVAFARGWVRNIRVQEAVRRLRSDEHSATKYRVIGTLSNNADFARVWGCKPGKDRMARSEEERCSIW